MDDLMMRERKRCVECVLSQIDSAADPVVKSLLFRIVNLIESGEENPTPFGDKDQPSE